MNRRLPALAILLGILGLIPFIVCGLGGVTLPLAGRVRRNFWRRWWPTGR